MKILSLIAAAVLVASLAGTAEAGHGKHYKHGHGYKHSHEAKHHHARQHKRWEREYRSWKKKHRRAHRRYARHHDDAYYIGTGLLLSAMLADHHSDYGYRPHRQRHHRGVCYH